MNNQPVSKARSYNMSRIRNKDTKTEIKVRSMLHRLGYRFRLHRKDIPGNPDIVLPKYRTVIFVHGCFWHRHPCCKYAYSPKTRVEFWEKKFADNVRRDRDVKELVTKAGWKYCVIWECEVTDTDLTRKTLQNIKKIFL